MPNNHFSRGELYSFITGLASTALARRLQKNFKQEGVDITVEQWSVLYHLWKEDGLSQQELWSQMRTAKRMWWAIMNRPSARFG